MQRMPKTGSMPPAPGYGVPPPNAPYRAPSQQFSQAGAPPNPASQFNMAPPPYATAPPPSSGQYGAPQPPYATAPNPSAPYGSQPPYGSAPPPQQYGMQQPYGNPPIQQPPMQQPLGSQYGQPPYGAPAGMAPGMGAPGGYVGSVSLAKGGNMSLTKANPNLNKIRIGLGWDVRQTGGPAFDLDASCFLLKGDGRVRMAQDLIFYNNKTSVDGAVYHHGDNLTGVGEGDDEIISIDLSRVPMEIQKVVFVVSIYEAEMRQQNFGMVSRAFIRVVDDLTNQEMCRFDLTEEASLLNTMIFGEVYRYGNEWKFRAVGQGIQGGLKAIGGMFGLNLQ